ncbi:MAG: Gfo/Idh/MocA family oxidoreductase [Planctomycetes bacterium]|nr:Gfo/Idh/MocA family oxidoreductase [Planctomycetota bacterium]
MNRRTFLQSGMTGLSLAALGPRLFAAEKSAAPRTALIGCGWYGKADLLRLIQVAPVDVVGLCDVDKTMLSEAADIVSQRQKSQKRPETFGDYRELLKQTQPELVLIATPDHWHALPAIAAIQSGADLYLQKPISVDVVEGQAILAAARKHKRVVQIGTQRRSTPHLAEARDKILKEGKLGTIGLVEIYCYYHMRARENRADSAPPANLDYEMWTGPAPMRPYNSLVHPRRWRAFMEYGNGIVGDMCVHMLDMVRWMLDLGWPDHVASDGGIYVDKQSRANISDTQTATFQFGNLPVVWTHRTWGSAPDPQYPWGATFYGDRGTLKCSVNSFDFIPNGGAPVHRDVEMELEQYPEDKTEKDLEKHVAPAIRRHMQDLLKARESRGLPIADVEQGHISSASCILANMSMELGRSLKWDQEKQRIAHDDEANLRLRRPYRAPWKHPEPDQV